MSNVLTIKLNSKELLKKVFPSMVLMVIISMYTLIDSLFVSNFVGTSALASLNLAFPLITLISAFGFMLSTGGMAWVAIKIGAGKREKAIKDFSFIVYFGIIATIIIVMLILPFLDILVKLLGAKDLVLFNYTKTYLFWILIFSPFFILQILFQSFLFVDGNGKLAVFLTILSGLTNIFMDYVFIVLLDLGIQGASFGTGIGYLVTAIIGSIYFYKNKKGIHFTKPSYDFKVIKGSLSNGMSEMVTNISSSITTYYFNYLTLRYLGVEGVAAISIILYCQFLFSSIFFGLCIGSSPLIGNGWGANDFKYSKKLIYLNFKFIFFLSLLMFIIAFFGSPYITSLFCDRDNPVFLVASNALKIFSFSFLFCGFSIFTSNVFTSIGDGKRSAFVSLLRVFILTILFLTILPPIFGSIGIWISIPIVESIMILVDFIFIKKLFKRIS